MSLLPVLAPATPASEALARVMNAADIPESGRGSANAVADWAESDPGLALRLIAGWLSTREAIWWSALCQAQLLKVAGNPGPVPLLSAIIGWTCEPSDKTRAAVGAPGDRGDASPVAMLAQAVAFTTDNLSPVKNHPVPCPPGVAHRMVALSVLTAVKLWPGSNGGDCRQHFIELGLDVSDGKLPWTPDLAPSHPGLRPVIVVPPRRTDGNIWENW